MSEATPTTPSSEPPPSPGATPKVLIVGAGIGGLTLAILLERAGVPYEIYERAKQVRPLGSAISLGSNVLPLLKQLGLLEEYLKMAKPTLKARMCDDQRGMLFEMDLSFVEELGGYHGNIVPRPAFYALLLGQIPPHKIHMSKKVLSLEQSQYGVMIRTSDNKTHHGDILVGADGAYSGVRQSLYKVLKDRKELPAGDKAPLPYRWTCLVGVTREIGVEEYPDVASLSCDPWVVIGDKVKSPYSSMVFPTANRTISWCVLHQLDAISSKQNDAFMNSEWGPEAAQEMCKEVAHIQIPGGKTGDWTIGHLIERTDKDLISKVMLEEKVFETWYKGRTVLMGDAVHKLNPSGSQGAVNAMQDAVALANWINVIPSTEVKDCEKIFKAYREERYPLAIKAFEGSQMSAKSIAMNFTGEAVRFMSKHLPGWFQRMALAKMVANRPQVSFLPLVEDKGSVPASAQPSLIKTSKILKDYAAAAASAAMAEKEGEAASPVVSMQSAKAV